MISETQPLHEENSGSTNSVTGEVNHLAGETSPYLLQHAKNPVDWYPWGEEALTRSRLEKKPLFLSIGYAACHWCHVMERESFENDVIAGFLNTHFISIKVDREERPDLDEIYMTAVVAMTGSGGWPLNVFLTPELKPFYGGTYFPPVGRYGMPSFLDVLQYIVSVWHANRPEALRNAKQLTAYLQSQGIPETDEPNLLSPRIRENGVKQLEAAYDQRWGGWGTAPKFPSPASITLLCRQYERNGDPLLRDMALTTLRRMALGGIHDLIGGGFHRYSTDEKWLVPHFEKMLYDNAQLALSYLEAWQITQDPFFKNVAESTLRYVLRDMRGDHGAFFASEDADSGGEEGSYYVWTRDEIIECLGVKDGNDFCEVYSVQEQGNFASHETHLHGQNILFRGLCGMSFPEDGGSRYVALREKLLAVRQKRVRPAVDDKIITAWNALMISALARAAFTWNAPEYKEAAIQAGEFIRNFLIREGIIYRTWRTGKARFPGYLDDYSFLANSFIDLYECTAESSWLTTAKEVIENMIDRFYDQERGGFYSTEDGHADLLLRVKPLHDTAEPSANAMAALALARAALFFDLHEYTGLAERSLALAAPRAVQSPLGYLHTILAADYLLEAPAEIIFSGGPERADIQALIRILSRHPVSYRIIAWAQNMPTALRLPLCDHKPMLEDRGTVYVCRHNTCHPPENTVEGFDRLLRRLTGHDSSCQE